MTNDSRSSVDDIVERLQRSDTRAYRDSTFLGFHHGKSAYPVLLPDKLWESGFWILGAARSGKSQRVLASLATQRIRRNDSPVAVIDNKGDPALMHMVELEARKLNRKFLLFTNVSRFATRLYNPLSQKYLAYLNRVSITEQFLITLNLFFGFAYAKSFFGGQSYQGWSSAYLSSEPSQDWGPKAKTERATSFVQLAKRLPEALKHRPELRGAEALTMVLRQLADVFILNAGCCDIYPKSAVDASIDVLDVLTKSPNGTYPILYAYLRAESEPVTTSVSGKLLINQLKTGMQLLRDLVQQGVLPGPVPVLPIFIDECQLVLDDALRNMLEQGASLGLQFVLANQDISQLRSGDRDYSQTVWENLGNKIILTARDSSFQELLMKVSGEKATHHLAYEISGWSLSQGRVGPGNAIEGIYKVAEMVSPRWEYQSQLRISHFRRVAGVVAFL